MDRALAQFQAYQLSGSAPRNAAASSSALTLKTHPERWFEILLPESQLVNMNLRRSAPGLALARPDLPDASTSGLGNMLRLWYKSTSIGILTDPAQSHVKSPWDELWGRI